MTKQFYFKPEYVEFIPPTLEHGVIYISNEFATAAHLCACGCGNKVMTPLSPTGWRLTTYGNEITLTPSIGNWSFACRSHYFITRNRVQWAEDMSDAKIQAGRKSDRAFRERYFAQQQRVEQAVDKPPKRGGWFLEFIRRLFGL